jgi:hypothetical protein
VLIKEKKKNKSIVNNVNDVTSNSKIEIDVNYNSNFDESKNLINSPIRNKAFDINFDLIEDSSIIESSKISKHF